MYQFRERAQVLNGQECTSAIVACSAEVVALGKGKGGSCRARGARNVVVHVGHFDFTLRNLMFGPVEMGKRELCFDNVSSPLLLFRLFICSRYIREKI
jgi:hypothetical protein